MCIGGQRSKKRGKSYKMCPKMHEILFFDRISLRQAFTFVISRKAEEHSRPTTHFEDLFGFVLPVL